MTADLTISGSGFYRDPFADYPPCWLEPMFNRWSKVCFQMWEWSGKPSTPVSEVNEVMRSAGFEPFQGFPLCRVRRRG